MATTANATAPNTSRRDTEAGSTCRPGIPELLRRIYETMVLTRAVEDRMVAMYKGGDLLGSLYTGHWHEAISVGAASTLRPDDYMAPIHRDLGAHLYRGMEPWQVMASFMGKATSPTGGRDGTLHYGRLDLGHYNLPSHIPANFPVATGMAFAAKYRGQDKVCLAFCGDGSTSRADFHEALTMSSALGLPNVFVIENNQFAYSTPLSMQSNSETFAAKAVALRHSGRRRSTAPTCWPCTTRSPMAVARARAGNGPSIVEGVTMRMHGHAEHDPADYVPKAMYEEWSKKDPVELFEKVLLDAGVIDADAAAQVRKDARQVAIDARRKALGGSDAGSGQHRGGRLCRLTPHYAGPADTTDPGHRSPTWRRSDWRWITRWTGIPTSSSSVRTSASTAAPSRSPRDSWTSTARGGWSTPLSPRPGSPGSPPVPHWSGLRPVVEFQFADFISCAFDPIINVLARHHCRTGDPMPVTMRAPFGGRLRAGPMPLAERGELLRARARHQDRHARHAARCRGAVDLVDPGQQPDAVPGEQVPVPAAQGRRSAVDGARSRWGWRTWSGRAGTSP